MARNSNTGCVAAVGLIALVLAPIAILVQAINAKSVGDAIGMLALVAVALALVVWAWTRS